VLEAANLPLGTVTGIAAQLRYEVTVGARRAMQAPAPWAAPRCAGRRGGMILAVESIARADDSDLVATVGRMAVLPGAANVIPGETVFTLDVRAGDEGRRDRAAEAIWRASAIWVRARAGRGIEKIHDLPASPCAPDLMTLMDEAIVATGQKSFRLVSGAGHDAMVMAAMCPTAMLFIRCRTGSAITRPRCGGGRCRGRFCRDDAFYRRIGTQACLSCHRISLARSTRPSAC
jgi:allantoate deiminase